jgi:nucleoside-triphosphatase THEP1
MNNNLEVPAKIIEAIKAKKLLVFVGAGMSVKFDLPDWKKMATDVIKDTAIPEYQGYITVLENKLFTPLEVLDKIESEKRSVYTYIENNFIINKSLDLETHKNLIKISGKIVTTNYDNAFEVAKEGIYTVPHNSVFKISNISDKSEYVFKMHGSASHDGSECIVFSNDYENLYSRNNAAIFKMSELFINNTILFIGFGFADPYVNKLFSTMGSLFQGNHTHYLLTTTPDKFKEFKYIRPIALDNYSQIDEFIKLCIPYSADEPIKLTSKPQSSSKLPIPRIAILYPNCLDLPELKSAKSLLTCFDSLEAKLHKGFLNTKALQEIEDYDILFIITSSYKGKLYIEGVDFKSQLTSIEDIMLSIPNDKIPTVIITDTILNTDSKFNIACISSYKNEILNKFIYKILKNNESDFKNENVDVSNFTNNIKYNKLDSKLVSKLASMYGKLNSINFTNKSIEDLVGRVEEQAAIARKLISITSSRKSLTIKGAGGTGKTTLVKKVSHSLYERGYFKNGVVFTSCEQVKNFKDFEQVLINAFNLNSITNFRTYLQENDYKLDLLIILDNFETITSLEDESDIHAIYELLEFVLDFAYITTTSREILDENFEDVFTLSSMITDDAVDLFKRYYGDIQDKELSILRHDILENLLNNNPLAIKLVTKISVRQNSLMYLREQLQDSFLESTSLNFESIFDKKADVNVERTKSIFQSINYSYCKLSDREKLAFELLHLFPDGISISDFKAWFNKEDKSNKKKSVTLSKISDVDLRALSNKSLIENQDGVLQLQPIVRRFAEFQFNKKGAETKKVYYGDAFSFNSYILGYLSDVYFRSVNTSMKLHNLFKSNLLLVLDYIPHVDISEKSEYTKQMMLSYAVHLIDYVLYGQQTEALLEKLPSLYEYFKEVENGKDLLKVATRVMIYYSKNFDTSYRELCDILPPEEMLKRNFNNEEKNEKSLRNRLSAIHSMEGHTLDFINSYIKNNYRPHGIALEAHLFYLGIHIHLEGLSSHFHTFQKDYVHNKLDIKKLETYIDSIFQGFHLEKVQCNFILSKVKNIPIDEIKKLVITNPYTRGLKDLMLAFNSQNNSDKEKHFNYALKHLNHIKYYYLEALYYYCKFLYKTNDSRFEKNYNEGLSLSKKFHYQYLEFRFNQIVSKTDKIYECDYAYYPLPETKAYVENFVSHSNKELAKGNPSIIKARG